MPTSNFRLIDPPRAGTNQKGEVINPAFFRNMPLHDYLVQLGSNASSHRTMVDSVSISAAGERMTTGVATTAVTTPSAGAYILYSKPVVFPTAGAVRLFVMTPNLPRFNVHLYMNVTVFANPGQAAVYPFVAVDIYQYNYLQYNADQAGVFEFPQANYSLLQRYTAPYLRNANYSGTSGINSWTTHWVIPDLLPVHNYRFIPRIGQAGAVALPTTANYELVADPTYLSSSHPAKFEFSASIGG